MYGLECHWRDGTPAVSFEPLTFIEHVAALVPPPRAHQLTDYGVLAPTSAWRDLVVPKRTKAPLRPLARLSLPPHRAAHRLFELLSKVMKRPSWDRDGADFEPEVENPPESTLTIVVVP